MGRAAGAQHRDVGPYLLFDIPINPAPLNIGYIADFNNLGGGCIPLTSLCWPGISLGRVGASIGASLGARFGMTFDAGINPGSITAQIPFDASLQLPNAFSLSPGEKFLLKTATTYAPGSTLASEFASAYTGLSINAAIDAYAGASRCFGGCWGTTFLDYHANVNAPLLRIGTSDVKFDFTNKELSSTLAQTLLSIADDGVSLLSGYGPDIAGNQALATALALVIPTLGFQRLAYGVEMDAAVNAILNNRLVSDKRDEILRLEWDLDRLATGLYCGFPLSLLCTRVLENNLNVIGIGVEYDIFDIDLALTAGLRQILSLDLEPRVKLDIDGAIHDLKLGESLELTVPTDGILEIEPVFYLKNTIRNQTALELSAGLVISALSAKIDLVIPDFVIDVPGWLDWLIPDFTIPLPDIHISGGPLLRVAPTFTPTFGVFDETWVLPFESAIVESFEYRAASFLSPGSGGPTSVAAPPAIASMLAGLLALVLVRRRSA
ncbi:MAG: hypothetical protein FJX67_11925 [Alphaproteobacteria bacterium]|nr:hypothetical protein [Alphaproteobacteria bacterium]